MATVKYPESGGAYREARASQKERVTQEALAAAVGVSPRTIMRIENGQTRPHASLRDRIAEKFGVDPSTLPASADPFVSVTTRGYTLSRLGFSLRSVGLSLRKSKP